MMYKIKELETELDVESHQIRYWISQGLPQEYNKHGHIVIYGLDLAAWIKENKKSIPKAVKTLDQAYCFKCRINVKLENPALEQKEFFILYKSICPNCSTPINKGVKYDHPTTI